MTQEKRKVGDFSIKQLREMCQATAPNPARESKVGKFSRVFSIYFTKLFLQLKFTPTHLNILSVLVFLAGVSLFIFNEFHLNLIASGLIFLSIVFDGCDGEMARLLQCTSGFAARYNEPVSHDVEYGLMFIPITIGLYLDGFSILYVFAGLLASIFKLMERSLRIRFLFAKKESGTHEGTEKIKEDYYRKPAHVRLIYWIEKNFYSSTGVFLILFILSIFDSLEYSVWIFGIGWGLFWLALMLKQFYVIGKQKLLS